MFFCMLSNFSKSTILIRVSAEVGTLIKAAVCDDVELVAGGAHDRRRRRGDERPSRLGESAAGGVGGQKHGRARDRQDPGGLEEGSEPAILTMNCRKLRIVTHTQSVLY